MARPLRVEYEGAIYHVMNRGDHSERIYQDDGDAKLFIKTLGEACLKSDWQVHAYCLMSNHFHLVVETPNGNLIAGMKWFLGTYTGRYNRRHQVFGHLFSGRYKSLIVDGSEGDYLRTVCEYVHLNPVRAKMLRTEEPLKNYRWSSFPQYLKTQRRRPEWLRVDRVLGDLGIRDDGRRGRERFERVMEELRAEDDQESYRRMGRGWFLGGAKFGKILRERMAERVGANHFGEMRRESREAKAERIIQEELKSIGWSVEDLERTRKGDEEKVRIAHRVREKTTVSLEWIGKRLRMGTVNYVNNRLYLWRQGRLKR